MGASTVVSQLIMFIAVLSIATGLIFGIKSFTDNAELAAQEKGKALNMQIKTAYEIEHVYYNNNTEVTSIYLRNTGETMISPDQVDVYIDGIRIPRNSTNRTITILTDTETVNPDIWDPKEKIHIQVFMALSNTITHEILVTTPYSGSEKETFSVS